MLHIEIRCIIQPLGEINMNTGDMIVKAMSKLSDDEWKYSVLICFQEYKEQIHSDDRQDPWHHFLDLIALKWRYYGDLDIYIDEMETRLAKELVQLKTREQINQFIKSIGDFKDEHDQQIEEMKKEWGEPI